LRIRIPRKKIREEFRLIYELHGVQKAINFLASFPPSTPFTVSINTLKRPARPFFVLFLAFFPVAGHKKASVYPYTIIILIIMITHFQVLRHRKNPECLLPVFSSRQPRAQHVFQKKRGFQPRASGYQLFSFFALIFNPQTHTSYWFVLLALLK